MGRNTKYPYEGGEATPNEVFVDINGLYGHLSVELRLQRGCDTRAKVMAYCGNKAMSVGAHKRNKTGLTPAFVITPPREAR